MSDRDQYRDDGGYPIHLVEEVRPDGRTSWLAIHPDLPGCNATGTTQDEAIENLSQSREAWLKTAPIAGYDAPEAGDFWISVEYARNPIAQRTGARQTGADEAQLVPTP
jgi:predicted RNase H-like HicB family nuclease